MTVSANELELETQFKSCCEFFFKAKFQQNRFLYFEIIPYQYFGTDYKIEIIHSGFEWIGKTALRFDIYKGDDRDSGKKRCVFQQKCSITYVARLNSVVDLNRQTKIVNFYADTLEPFGESISVRLMSEELIAISDTRKLKGKIKEAFKIQYLDELTFDKDSIGFAFFTDILRKERLSKANDSNVSHGYFYWEIANCHREIEICLLASLLHQKYSSDLLDGKGTIDGKDFYMPQLGYNDFQYLTMVGFGFDRLYSFWDRITFLLAKFEGLEIAEKQLSFNNYFKEIEKRCQNGKKMLFDSTSEHLKWLMEFRKNEFSKIENYRHRNVHFKMTSTWEGTLPSKFYSNTMEHISNPNELKKVKLEFDGLGPLLHKQFEFCIVGFKKALYLIDEIE